MFVDILRESEHAYGVFSGWFLYQVIESISLFQLYDRGSYSQFQMPVSKKFERMEPTGVLQQQPI